MLQNDCPDIELYLAVLNQLTDAIIVVDAMGNPLLCNPAAETLLPGGLAGLGGSGGAIAYQFLDRHQQPIPPSELPLQRVMAGQHLQNEEFVLAEGTPPHNRWVAVSGTPFPIRGAAALVTLRDITALKRKANLSAQALHDPLTGLPNRNLFMDRLSHALARTHVHHPDLNLTVLLVIGLERSQAIEDPLGRSLGDELVVQVAQGLQAQVGPQTTLTHLGGGEFAILLEDMPTSSRAIDLAEQLRTAIQQPGFLQQQDVQLDSRVGIALGPATYHSAADWLRDAYSAMHHTKESPDRSWHVFDNGHQVPQNLELQTEIDLRQALERGELRLHYQPIVTLNNQEICGFEALVRWQHPTRGLLLPGEFIHIAETTELIVPLGWWVMTEACRQMQLWTVTHPAMESFTVNVNMSSKQFSQPHLVAKIQQILDETGFSPHRLKIEITEGVLIDHSDSIIEILVQIKAMGIHLLVDDFGTGYSSLSYLHRFPFDCLKIDRSFIENADQDFEKLEILQSVVRLAWNLGLDVVAEGVETPRHHAQLKALRCELGQGYLFSRPMAPDAVEAMMAEKLAPALDAVAVHQST